MSTDPLIGREIDGYVIEKLLGHGGMARVYRAIEENLSRFVAIKIIDPRSDGNAEYRERFKLEARAIAKLNHPGIVNIYRFGEFDDLYYMAMDYIDGSDLKWMLDDYRHNGEQMPYESTFRVIESIAKALDFAHKQGVIHRDVKPSNIMLNSRGEAILTDFGLALMTSEGTQGLTFGSPHYISPEQAVSSGGVVTQSDLYSLGVTLYEMISGHLPFIDGTPLQIAMAHLSDPVPDPRTYNPGVHSAFVPVLLKALAKEPEHRYPTGAKLVTALKGAIIEARKNPEPPKLVSRSTPPPLRISRTDITEKVVAYRKAHPLPEIDTTLREMQETRNRLLPRKSAASGRRSLLPVLLIALILLVMGGVGVGVLLPALNRGVSGTAGGSEVAPNLPVAVGVVSPLMLEGVVHAVAGSQITIYDLAVHLPDQVTLPDDLAAGDLMHLEGTYQFENDGSLTVMTVSRMVVNGKPVPGNGGS